MYGELIHDHGDFYENQNTKLIIAARKSYNANIKF